MKIAAVTVLYNTPEDYIVRLKKEITLLGIKDFAVIDNTQTGYGYAKGINMGIAKFSNADAYLLMNPDITLDEIQKEQYLDGLKQFDILGFTMKQEGTNYCGGTIDPLRMSGGLIEASRNGKDTRFVPVDFVSGSCMIVKREVLESIGNLDESYGMYYEDVEYCFRAAKRGFTCGIDTSQRYTHYEVSRHNPKKNVQLEKSRLRFLLRYGSFKQKAYEVLRLPKTIAEYLTA